jgi:hypothetical protein
MTEKTELTLDKRRVHKVVKVTVESTQKVKNLEAIEAIIGFSEALGRIIVAQNVPEAGHQELIKVACLHVIQTVKSAYDESGRPSNSFTVN